MNARTPAIGKKNISAAPDPAIKPIGSDFYLN